MSYTRRDDFHSDSTIDTLATSAPSGIRGFVDLVSMREDFTTDAPAQHTIQHTLASRAVARASWLVPCLQTSFCPAPTPYGRGRQ
jgi:hypothetical protein